RRLYPWTSRLSPNLLREGPRVQRSPGLPCALLFSREGDKRCKARANPVARMRSHAHARIDGSPRRARARSPRLACRARWEGPNQVSHSDALLALQLLAILV